MFPNYLVVVSIEIHDDLVGHACVQQLESGLEVGIVNLLGYDFVEVNPHLYQVFRLAPGVEDVAALDALDGDHFEDDLAEVEVEFVIRDPQHGQVGSRSHHVDHVIEGGLTSGHLEPHVDALHHADIGQLLLVVRTVFGVEHEVCTQFGGCLQAFVHHVRHYDFASPSLLGDHD